MAAKIFLDWNKIDTVFLDMDGTLLDLHYDNHFWLEYLPTQYAKKHQISLDNAKDQLKARYGSFKGTLNWYCIDHWSKQLDMDMLALKQETSQRIKVRENVEHFLQFLQQQQKRIILLTNAHPKTIAIKFQHTSIEPYFDKIITSHDIGLAKEQTGFWEKLQQQFDFNKERSLFIDDNLNVLRTAKRYNIGYLLAIHQPDSQQKSINTEEFTAIECFTQLS